MFSFLHKHKDHFHTRHKVLTLIGFLGIFSALFGAYATQNPDNLSGKIRFFNENQEEVVLDTEAFENSPYQAVIAGDLSDLQIRKIHHRWDKQNQNFVVEFDVFNIPQPGSREAVEASIDHYSVDFHAVSQNAEGQKVHFIQSFEGEDGRWIPGGSKERFVVELKADQKTADWMNANPYHLVEVKVQVDRKNTTPEWDEYNNDRVQN